MYKDIEETASVSMLETPSVSVLTIEKDTLVQRYTICVCIYKYTVEYSSIYMYTYISYTYAFRMYIYLCTPVGSRVRAPPKGTRVETLSTTTTSSI